MLKKYYVHKSVVMKRVGDEIKFFCEACGRELPGFVAPFPCGKDTDRYFLVHGDVGFALRLENGRPTLGGLYLREFGRSLLLEEGHALRPMIYVQPMAAEPLLQEARRLLFEEGPPPGDEVTMVPIPPELEDYFEGLIEAGAVQVELVPIPEEEDEQDRESEPSV